MGIPFVASPGQPDYEAERIVTLRADLSRVQRPARAYWRRVLCAQRFSALCSTVNLRSICSRLFWRGRFSGRGRPPGRLSGRRRSGVASATLFEADFMRGWMCSGILSAAQGVPSSPSEKCTRLQYPAHACVC